MDPNGGCSRHRPAYHFTAAGGWMGDPNGLIYHDGLYHVMYQHNPDTVDFLGNDTWRKMEKVPWGPAANPGVPKGIWGLYWGNVHWGHAVSRDLVHWEHWPVAISPTPDGYDPGGCFSGVTVIHDGVPTIVYSSITKTPASGIRSLRAQSIATSSDGMRTWTKYPGNPVLADVPDTSGLMHAWHDPHVWQEEDTWYMAVGCGFQNVAGAILLYRSPTWSTGSTCIRSWSVPTWRNRAIAGSCRISFPWVTSTSCSILPRRPVVRYSPRTWSEITSTTA